MNTSTPKFRVNQVIDFNPAWLDENGFMTNVPGPNFLSSLNLSNDGANSAIGVYIKKRSFGERRPDDEELLRFTIRGGYIRQELPYNNTAQITSNEIKIEDSNSILVERWYSFLNREGEKVWRLCGEVKMLDYDQSPDLVPATIQGLFYALDKRLLRAWVKIGNSREDAKGAWLRYDDKVVRPILGWNYSLFSLANNRLEKSSHVAETAPSEQWKFRATGDRERELWLAVMGYTAGILSDPHSSDHLQVEREAQIMHFVSQALALKEAA